MVIVVKKASVSVVMASFNEEKAIEMVIRDIKKNTEKYETEIVVVDSSKDNTAKIAKKLGARVIWQEPCGHGAALKLAIGSAKNGIIITTDCDNTYPMEYIPQLVDLVTTGGYDYISCNRMTKNLKEQMPLTNRIANKVFALLVRAIYRLDVHDVSTGMICMKKEVGQGIFWDANKSFNALPCEIMIRSKLRGFKHKEIDIPYRVRVGEVKLPKWDVGKAYLKCVFKYAFKKKSVLVNQ